MNLYSITIEYDTDGIYIEQVEANTPDEAIMKWATNLHVNKIKGVGSKIQVQIIEELKSPEGKCEKVHERTNMWSTCAYVRGQLFLFHIIKTTKA